MANPPATPDAVVDAVLAAEGFDPGGPVVASGTTDVLACCRRASP